jgi:glc operon protein GlcG
MSAMTRIALLLIALAAGSSTLAQTPAPSLDAKTAQNIITGCAAHAAAKGQSHAIAVVDSGGQLVAAWRMDGNGYGVMDFAMAKARAVAAWGFPTSGMAEAIKTTPGFAAAPHVVTVAGGVPVFAADGRTRIGGVGVSGEPPEDDAACAMAGIAAAGLRSARAPSN